jgi:hypothetical protein
MECNFFNLTFNMAIISKTTELQAAIERANANVNRLEKALKNAKNEAAQMQEQLTEIEQQKYLVCIKQGNNYFREHGRGYTAELARAGVYTITEARNVAKRVEKIKLFNAKTGEPCR